MPNSPVVARKADPITPARNAFRVTCLVAFYGLFATPCGYGLLSVFAATPVSGVTIDTGKLFDGAIIDATLRISPWQATALASFAIGLLAYFVMHVAVFRATAGYVPDANKPLQENLRFPIAGLAGAPVAIGAYIVLGGLLTPFQDRVWALASGALTGGALAIGGLVLRRASENTRFTTQWKRTFVKRAYTIAAGIGTIVCLLALALPLSQQKWVIALPVTVIWFVLQMRIFSQYQAADDSIATHGHSVSPASFTLLVVAVPAAVAFSIWASSLASDERTITPASSAWSLAIVTVAGFAVAWRSFWRRDVRHNARAKIPRTMPTLVTRKRSGRKDRRGTRRRRNSQYIWSRRLRSLRRRIMRACAGAVRGGIFACRVLLEFVRLPISFLDHFLATTLAKVFGAHLEGRLARYSILLAQFAAVIAILLNVAGPLGYLAFIWASLAVLSVARRWNWIEADRDTFLISKDDRPAIVQGIRVGFNQDLGDEVVFAFLAYFCGIIPAAIWSINLQYGLFDHPAVGDPTFWDWLLFVGGELLKALPFIDWSEIYGFDNQALFVPVDERGKHVIFAMRAAMDVLLVTTLLQAFSAQQRNARRQKQIEDPNDPTFFQDVFEERDLLRRIQSDPALLHSLRFYDDDRLVLLLKNGDDKVTLIGAAMLSGYGLASNAMRFLISPPVRRSESRSTIQIYRSEALGAMVRGLSQRLNYFGNSLSFPALLGVTSTVKNPRAAAQTFAAIEEELKKVARVRATALDILRVAKASEVSREEALDSLKRRSREDLEVILVLVTSNDTDTACTAVQGLSKITRASKYYDWISSSLISLLEDNRVDPVVGVEIVGALVRLRHEKSDETLVRIITDKSVDSKLRVAAIGAAADLGGHASAALRGALHKAYAERSGWFFWRDKISHTAAEALQNIYTSRTAALISGPQNSS